MLRRSPNNESSSKIQARERWKKAVHKIKKMQKISDSNQSSENLTVFEKVALVLYNQSDSKGFLNNLFCSYF